MRKTILVTGGTGFIGSHTCLVLVEKNFKIIVIDSNVNSTDLCLNSIKKFLKKNNSLIPDIFFSKGDIRDRIFLEKVFSKALKNGCPIEGVIHFAGLKSVEESVKDPLNYWDNNVLGTLNLLKVMEKYYCKTIVFSSSATIYGSNNINPIKEDYEINPINPYGHTKASVEYMLEGIFKSNKEEWRIANLRYFNPIGAHESGFIGEDPINKPNNLFPYICSVAKENMKS